jgi:hypothetical protein
VRLLPLHGRLLLHDLRGHPGAIERSKSAAFNAAIEFARVLSARVIANLINAAVVR